MNDQTKKRVQPEQVTIEQALRNRKAAKKTAIVLAVVAVGFFVWSVYIVMNHANG